MRRPSGGQNDGNMPLSRGVSSLRSRADEAAFLDGVIPPEERIPRYRDDAPPLQSYNSIAVVVGKRPSTQRPISRKALPPEPPQSKSPKSKTQWPRPRRDKPEDQKPVPPRRSPRHPPQLAVSRGPALHVLVRALVERKAADSTAMLRRAYSTAFNPDDRYAEKASDEAGLSAYLMRSFENQRRAGGRVLAIALIVGGGWATLVPLSGAVVIPGTVVAESKVKKVQHQTGGIIASIAVTDGMRVREGDILVRLDDTQVRANFQVVTQQLDEIRARIARLTAERDGQALPGREEAGDRKDGRDHPVTTENSLFRARSDARRSQRELLRTRIAQLNEEIAGMEAQIKSKQTQADLIAQELAGVQQLWEKRLTPLTRLTSLQREAARLDGEKAQLLSNVAETRGKISEAELQLVKLDQDFKTDVIKDLREAQDKEAELIERVVAAKDQLAHISLRAPVNGIVHELAVHTVGGVVTPAEVVMLIVPDSDELQIDAHLPPDQINQVHKGQDTHIRFPAFNQRTTPELTGTVVHVSADITRDQPSSPGYYTVRVSLPGKEYARLGDLRLVAGMPAELFIQTGTRTMISYLFAPITEQFQRMFRER